MILRGFPAYSSLPGITGFKFSSSSAVIRDEHAQSRQASLEVFKNIVKCVEFHSVLQQAIFSLHISHTHEVCCSWGFSQISAMVARSVKPSDFMSLSGLNHVS